MSSNARPAPGAAETSTPTMQRAVVEPRGAVHVEEATVPVPGPGQALVRSTLVGICGSDTHALAGHHPFLQQPYAPGHEATGIVEATAPDASRFAVGQRVLLKPNVPCGACLNCEAGRTNACESLTWIGCDPSRHWSGAMGEYFVAPESNLFPIPDGLDDRTAVLVECLGTPVHAARIAGDLTGARVAVLGAGTIGVLCVLAALNAGADVVVSTDLDPAKLDRAVRFGARAGVLASSTDLVDQVRTHLGRPADVVFDCVANERSLAQGVDLLRRAGTLLVVGVPPAPAVVNLPPVQDWGLRLQGCAAYTEGDIQTAIDMAVAGQIPADDIICAVYPLREVSAAFHQAATDSSGKVLVVPSP